MESNDTGILIKDIRESMGMSASELAERTNISRNYLNRIERGLNDNISLDVAINLSKILCTAPAITTKQINLNHYNSPLAQLIMSEITKDEDKQKYTLSNDVIKNIAARYGYDKEIDILLKYLDYKGKIKYIRRLSTAYKDALNYYRKKENFIEPKFSQALVWLIGNTSFGEEFNYIIDDLLNGGSEEELLDWSSKIMYMLVEYLRYINGEKISLGFEVLCK